MHLKPLAALCDENHIRVGFVLAHLQELVEVVLLLGRMFDVHQDVGVHELPARER